MKKILSALLATSVVAVFSSTAFAAETKTIRVDVDGTVEYLQDGQWIAYGEGQIPAGFEVVTGEAKFVQADYDYDDYGYDNDNCYCDDDGPAVAREEEFYSKTTVTRWKRRVVVNPRRNRNRYRYYDYNDDYGYRPRPFIEDYE